MNYSNFDLDNNYLAGGDGKVYIYQPPENLTSIGIFISSILLSLGTFVSILCKNYQNKNKENNIIDKV
jgi:hypothetical protein